MSSQTEAERLTEHAPQVIELWAARVRQETSTPGLPEPVLLAALPELLDQLARRLRGENAAAEQAWAATAQQLGEQYAGLSEPSLAQLLKEYRLLRQSVVQVLDSAEPLSPESRDAIAGWVEVAMQQAAARYCECQRDRARSEEAQHRLLVENARDYAMFLTDCDSRITSWSTGAERLTGFTEAEILGASGEIIFTPEDRVKKEPEKELEKARTLGRAENERWHLRKDGSRFWGSGIMHAVYDDAGKLTGFGKVFRDRTAEQQAEEERKRLLQEAQQELAQRQRLEIDLRRINDRLHLLSEVAGTLLLSSEAEPIVAPVFRRLAAHLDLDVYFNYLVAPDRVSLQLSSCGGVPEALAARLRVLQFGQDVCGTAAENRCRIVSHDLHESSDPLFAAVRELGVRAYACYPLLAGNRLVGTLSFGSGRRNAFTADELELIEAVSNQVAVALDRTRLIRELAERAAALTEADQRKDEFLAMLAHELRNPLAPVLTSVAVMRLHAANDPTLQRLLETVERQVRQLTRLVDDLLDVSRITRGKIELRREPVDLLTIVAHAAETSRPLVENRGHQLVVSVPRGPVYVEGDPTRLEQVLINLLSNAARYTEPGGRIWLNVECEGETATLRVRDTGRGIPQDMLQDIFGLFTQVDTTLDRSAGGLGLGLTLVKRLVEMHGGQVTAFSEGPGRGSEFTLHFPRFHPHAAPPAELPAPEPVMTAVRSLRVLVVDDNVDASQTLSDLLEIWGHETRVAFDGHGALAVAAEFGPDVVLLDIGLPGLDGYEVARRLRSFRAPSPILVAVTGYGQEEDQRRAAEAGFRHHLTKPVEPSVLERLLVLLSESPAIPSEEGE